VEGARRWEKGGSWCILENDRGNSGVEYCRWGGSKKFRVSGDIMGVLGAKARLRKGGNCGKANPGL